MSDDSVLSRLEAITSDAEIDERALNSEAARVGSDIEGLRLLVERYAHSDNRALVRAVTFPLARAPWELSDAGAHLKDVVFSFLRATATSDDVGTLTGSATALQGLSARRLLVLGGAEDQAVLCGFVAHCLEHPDLNVRGVCLHLLGHLHADGVLERALSAEMLDALRSQLRRLGRDTGTEFTAELAALDGFLAVEDTN